MESTTLLGKYEQFSYNIFKWRYELKFVHKILLSLSFALFTGILAQVKFYLPWTPVPITGQTFGVFLSAIMLGRFWGGFSQLIYVFAGSSGIPWFAGWLGGIGYLIGPTGGYLAGFIIAAFFLGHYVDKYIRARNFWTMFLLLLISNFVIIYGLGLFYLYAWLYLFKGNSVSLSQLLMMGATPFVAGDLIKIFASAMIAKVITPKRAYCNEVDGNR